MVVGCQHLTITSRDMNLEKGKKMGSQKRERKGEEERSQQEMTLEKGKKTLQVKYNILKFNHMKKLLVF